MEPRFGVDFGQVQVHMGTVAAKSAAAVGARAFTVGNDIVFGAGQYMRGSRATQRLLAHELVHVVQQSPLWGRPYGTRPLIQRQAEGADDHEAQLRREYIELACEVIADIQRGVEEGRTWFFEDDFVLQGEEWLGLAHPTLVDERQAALQELVRGLDELILELESGALVPSDPADREALQDLWSDRTPRSIRSLARRWAPVTEYERLPGGEMEARFPSISWYMWPPDSPPGILQAGSFPTWWVVGCHRFEEREQPPARTERVTPGELGLRRDSVIFISRRGGEVTGWHWEPRRASHPEAARPFGPYDWHYDPAEGRVFIIVDGRQLDLLPLGRVASQR